MKVAAGMSVHSQVQFQGASLIYPPVLSLTRGGNSIASAEVWPIYRSWPQRDDCICLVRLREQLHGRTIDRRGNKESTLKIKRRETDLQAGVHEVSSSQHLKHK